MILLNIIYGLIMSLAFVLTYMLFKSSTDFPEMVFLHIWSAWTLGHIVYDAVAYRVVKFFNRTDDVYRG